ncbi:hypothetical protein B1L04_12330 [Microcystis aeruginosa KW]|uniref:Uncharacterized protein n=1 Tax=Microcystis aeruginosa KW TaxID=1960155 RepID=A0A1V4BRS3_MICAE|nr:hypothetical protein B1L04_12330 [Microcystis aeruginosa KW]
MGKFYQLSVGRWGDHCVRVAGGDGEMGEISTKTLKHQNPTPNPQPLFSFSLFTQVGRHNYL